MLFIFLSYSSASIFMIINHLHSSQEFVRQGKFDLNHLKRKRRQVQHELNEIAEYFGIDVAKSKPMELFSTVRQFLKDLSTANENLTKKALSRKNSSRAMMRSVSTPSSKRGSRNSSFRGSRNSSVRSSRNSSARSSIRRVYRSTSVTNEGSDVRMQAKKDYEAMDFQRSSSYSKSPSSEMSNSFLPRSFSESYTSATPVHRRDYDKRSMSLRRDEEEFDDVNERPKEPDLSKYRSLMKEYEEKRKNCRSMIGKEKSDDSQENRENSREEELRKVLLSPVKERLNRRRLFEDNRNIRNENETVKDLKIANASTGKADKIDQKTKDWKELEIHVKGREKSSCIDRSIDERKPDRFDAEMRMTDEKVKRNGSKDDTCGTEKVELEFDGNQNLLGLQGPDSPQDILLLKERPKELKTLHYRAKVAYEKETRCLKDANLIHSIHPEKRNERQKEQQNENFQIDLKEEAIMANENKHEEVRNCADLTTLRDSTLVCEGEDYGIYREDLKNTAYVSSSNNNGNHNGDHSAILRNEKIKNAAENITNTRIDGDLIAKVSNGKSNFVRGSTRNSRHRNSGRSSFKNEKGMRRVNIKAMHTKDIVKTMISSKSESSLGNMKLQRRHTKSEGMQAVILKPGFIAKNVPIKLELTAKNATNGVNSEVVESINVKTMDKKPSKNKEQIQNGNGLEKKEMVNSGDVYVDNTFELKDKEEPVLRRTKSAVIHRNLREAKLIFFL